MDNNFYTLIILGAIIILINIINNIIFKIKSSGKFKTINLDEAVNIIHNNKNISLIDVRTYKEIEKTGTIKNSLTIAFNDDNFENKISRLDKDKEYIVYCSSGFRASNICFKMSEMGFKNIFYLKKAGYKHLSKML